MVAIEDNKNDHNDHKEKELPKKIFATLGYHQIRKCLKDCTKNNEFVLS
jgi:hypothetical protein